MRSDGFSITVIKVINRGPKSIIDHQLPYLYLKIYVGIFYFYVVCGQFCIVADK